MLRHVVLTCLLLASLTYATAQTQPSKEGVRVEVVATAFEYVPTTVSHPGHSYTNCQGSTYYFAQFNSYGNSGSVSGTAETNTQCSSTFSPPSEDTTYRRVNYTIARGEQALYLLSCTQTTGSMAERLKGEGSLMGVLAARSTKCPAFAIGDKYTLTIRNTSDAHLSDVVEGKARKSDKLEFLSSVPLTASTTPPTPQPQANGVSAAREATVHFTSSPSGGEIYVDEKFVGNTPSDIAIAAGEHVVKVVSGGKEWSRSVQITGGEISLHADMPVDK
jgi:PEGA domain-containing protein